jgi:AAA family ATP:ADP antiporter
MATVTSAILIAQQVAGKAARDALFLSSFHSSSLPWMMTAGAVLSLASVVWLSRMMARRTPRRIMPVLFAANAAALTVAWTVGLSSPRASAIVVYLNFALFGAVMISTFWSLINEQFDPHTGKRAVARVAGGGSLGGVLGGLATWRAASLVEPATLIILLAALNAVGVACTLLIGVRKDAPLRLSEPDATAAATEVSAVDELRGAPFLRNLALLVALGSATSALLDYGLSVQAVAHFGKGPPLLSFFSLLWLAVGVLSFLLQMALGRVALEKLSLAVSIGILPGIILLGGAFGLAVPGLLSAVLLRGAEAVQRNTLFRSAYELLYTPLADVSKRTTKAVIDVGFDRLGTVVGSGMASLALFLVPADASRVLLGAVVLMALGTLPLVRRIHLGYVAALEERLKAGSTSAETAPPPESHRDRQSVLVAREKLIEEVEALQPGGLTAILETGSHPAQRETALAGIAVAALENPKPLLAVTSDLLSRDELRVRGALTRLRAPDPSLAWAILLLAHPEFHAQALNALRRVALAATGQLIDALLNPTMDFVVRRRIPRVLSSAPTQRAAEGLLLGIADERFEVRYECGRALASITNTNAGIVLARETLLEAIQREVESKVHESVDPELDEDAGEEEPNALVDALLRDRVGRSLEYVFTILSLQLEREPLRMAFRALYNEDTKYRGTALEYLDTVLPREVRDALWPLLGETGPLPPRRAAQEILAELALASGTRESRH